MEIYSISFHSLALTGYWFPRLLFSGFLNLVYRHLIGLYGHLMAHRKVCASAGLCEHRWNSCIHAASWYFIIIRILSYCISWIFACSRAKFQEGFVMKGTALQTGRSLVRSSMVSLEFFIDIILPAALLPWGWLSL